MFKKNKKSQEMIIPSNIIQFDDMGYPLMLCIVKKGKKSEQQWIDVSEEYAEKVIKNGEAAILHWNENRR